MKASFWKGFAVLLFTGIVFSHCGENNPVVPVDPCAEETPVTARFSIYENSVIHFIKLFNRIN